MSKPLTLENIDSGTGVYIPFYDEGTRMVYIVGKVSNIIICSCMDVSVCLFRFM